MEIHLDSAPPALPPALRSASSRSIPFCSCRSRPPCDQMAKKKSKQFSKEDTKEKGKKKTEQAENSKDNTNESARNGNKCSVCGKLITNDLKRETHETKCKEMKTADKLKWDVAAKGPGNRQGPRNAGHIPGGH